MEDVAVLLDVARDLMDQDQPDVDIMLDLLDRLPLDDLDAQTRGAIAHAQMVTAAALNKAVLMRPLPVALYRVVRPLEHVPVTVGYQIFGILTAAT